MLTDADRRLLSDWEPAIRQWVRRAWWGSRENLEDAEQNILCVICRRIHDYDPARGGIEHWLKSLVRGERLHELRRLRREPELVPLHEEQFGRWPDMLTRLCRPTPAEIRAMKRAALKERMRGQPPTQAEIEALALIAHGLTLDECAKALYITRGAVAARLECLYMRFGVRTATAAVYECMGRGLIQYEEVNGNGRMAARTDTDG